MLGVAPSDAVEKSARASLLATPICPDSTGLGETFANDPFLPVKSTLYSGVLVWLPGSVVFHPDEARCVREISVDRDCQTWVPYRNVVRNCSAAASSAAPIGARSSSSAAPIAINALASQSADISARRIPARW